MPTEEQLLEVHRLALLGGEADITRKVTGQLANSWLSLSRFREVRELCTKTLELGQDPDTVVSLARARRVLGEVAEAMRLYQDALKMYEEVGDRAGQATTLNNIGMVYYGTGQPDKALEYYQQALPITEEVGDRAGQASTLNNIGMVYYGTGQPAQALEYYQQALPLMEQVGNRAGESVTRYNLAMIYRVQGKLREAAEELKQVVQLDQLVQSPDLESDQAMLAEIQGEIAAL
jgi:tetratricopeptide (TPR) repeat protein